MRDDAERLRDILDAIERIERYAYRGRDEFERDELLQTWVVHHAEVIGEAVRALSPEAKSRHPEIPWQAIIGMLNALVHGYFEIDTEEIWRAVADGVPHLIPSPFDYGGNPARF